VYMNKQAHFSHREDPKSLYSCRVSGVYVGRTLADSGGSARYSVTGITGINKNKRTVVESSDQTAQDALKQRYHKHHYETDR